jgi:radical SAM superfamily enzyme YgiQ (UPF0313 family)
MPHVLLTHGYFLADDEKEQQIMKPYPPLGLLYLSAFLKREGLTAEVLDTTFAERGAVEARLGRQPGVVGIYTTLMTRASALDLVARARRHGWTVVLGGPDSANYPAEYLEHGGDVVVVGEGEVTLRALLEALDRHGPHRLAGVDGTVFRDEEGRLVHNPPREQIASLDALPWPDRAAIDVSRYVDVWRRHHGSGSVNLITARGCPYRCDWCSHAVYGFTHRRRGVVDVADEVEAIVGTYAPDQVWYADDVFTIHHRWLFEFRAEMRRRGLHVPFETISRADRLMNDEVLQALADLGCHRIWIGSESGSQRLLDAMQRGVTAEQVQWASRAAQRHGIEVGMFLMWGYEGETLEDIEATIAHVKAAAPTVFFTTVAYPIKNTGYYAKVADRVVPGEVWADSSDRDTRVRGRHSRTYYRHADRWLRAEVDAWRLDGERPDEAARRRVQADEARAALLAADPEVEA